MPKQSTPTEQKLDRKKRKAIRNRKKIKESGLDIFVEKGIFDTTIEDITETADLGKGTFYSHFENKETLFIELLEDSTKKLTDLINEYCAQSNTNNLENLLEKLLDAHFVFYKNHHVNFMIIFQGQGMLNLQKEDEKEILDPILNYIRAIENCLQEYTINNIPSNKLRKLACVVAGCVSGYFSFASISLSEKEIISILTPLKRAYVEALSTFLKEV